MQLTGFESDMFFNIDHSDSKIHDCKGQFERFDDEKLLAEATWFCECLLGCGGRELQPADVLADFFARL